MSKMNKCDRCHTTHASIENNSVCFPFLSKDNSGQACIIDKNIDLCPFCYHEFLEFVKPTELRDKRFGGTRVAQ